ncbi:MAG TPA: hypothetical protein VLM38_12555 [Blastocatellia bacterium]|nr:hypothetical protein [Blastocatellia bacterium]
MASTEFDKDFGYLMRFLDKVAAAASTLSDPAARAELTQLIADEKRRWARGRELLAGGNPAVETKPGGIETPTAISESSAAAKPAPIFTVGSLRP